jgi:hypothetical protein
LGNTELTCPAESPTAKPSNRPADGASTNQRCSSGVKFSEMLSSAPSLVLLTPQPPSPNRPDLASVGVASCPCVAAAPSIRPRPHSVPSGLHAPRVQVGSVPRYPTTLRSADPQQFPRSSLGLHPAPTLSELSISQYRHRDQRAVSYPRSRSLPACSSPRPTHGPRTDGPRLATPLILPWPTSVARVHSPRRRPVPNAPRALFHLPKTCHGRRLNFQDDLQ